MKKDILFDVDEDFVGKRLDIAVADKSGISRSAIKNHVIELKVNGKDGKPSYKCRLNDVIVAIVEWEDTDLVAESIPLDIVYEDDNYIVVNKKAGMVVHPAKGNYRGTLVNALLGLKKELPCNDLVRPGIVHRLDKDTSGLIIVAKNVEAHEYLGKLFRERKIKKVYRAVLKGNMIPLLQRVENNIGRDPFNRKKMAVLSRGGKDSLSIFRVIRYVGNLTYVLVRIRTGRTHQIRVHASHIGYPVLGDSVYSRKDNRYPDVPLCLVAARLTFFDKFSGKKLDFRVHPPEFIRSLVGQS